MECLKTSYGKFYVRFVDLIKQHEGSLSQIFNNIRTLDQLVTSEPF